MELDFGVSLHRLTISRCITRVRFSHKVIARVAEQRDKALRFEFATRIATYNAKDLVYVDKSAANERTCNRKYGWSPRGFLCVLKRKLKRLERWSILPAYTINNGYLPSTLIRKGSINGEEFAN